ncbi:MAG: hypothetical protein JXA49_04015 [Actinobacteria bacterium]|nr:hypothetical protein [Actinomycetota bacterium]
MISSKVLDFLLFGINLPLKLFVGIASLRSGLFRKSLVEEKFTMLIKTGDLKNKRYYRLEKGRFKSKGADCPDPDMSIVWSDTKAFADTVFKLNPLEIVKGFTGAMTAGKLAIEINIEALTAFVSVLSAALGVYKNFFTLRKLA